jgi:beta-glucosidase
MAPTYASLLVAIGVAAASAACPYTFCNDCDLSAGDLAGQPVSKTMTTLDECAAACCAVGYPCAAFSLNSGAAGGRWCYLKAAHGWTNSSIPGCDSGSLTNPPPPPPPGPLQPWFNFSLTQESRLQLLLDNLTVPEMIDLLNDANPAIPRLGLPAYSWEAEASHGVAWNGVATVFPSPISWGATFDVPLVSSIGEVIALEARAKWLDGLGTDFSSDEFRGLSFMVPNQNLFVDPRWGRGQETTGESPVLTAAMAAALVTALQFGPDPTYTKMIAVSKHYLGYHLESWAGDGQYRLSHSFNYSLADLEQAYLVSFKATVAANVSSIMCAYDGMFSPDGGPAYGPNPAWPNPGGNEPWGTPMCLNPAIQTVLRERLGWQGYIISDEGSITFAGPGYHAYTPTVKDAACLALNAGTDLALGDEYVGTLGACLADGNVTVATIRKSLERIMRAQFKLGWFDSVGARLQNVSDPVPYNAVSMANVSTPESRALSLLAARRGLVLLKNKGDVLPLQAANLKRVALVGPTSTFTGTATSSYVGNYAGCQNGPGGASPSDPRCAVVDLLSAITNRSVEGGFTLAYAPGSDINSVNTSGFPAALAAAAGADVILAAMGLDTCQETSCSEGEANDRAVSGGQFPNAGLDLPGSQLQLLQALRAANPSAILVLILLNGGPISSPLGFAAADAILEAWYPGYEAGTAIADALFGDYSPAGRMPMTIVSDAGELPLYTDMSLAAAPGRTHMYYTGTPLFPFGFGLSYTSMVYSALSLTPSTLAPGNATFTVTATVTNVGTRASGEVAQLYGSFDGPSSGKASVPRLQLLAFTRLHDIGAGESESVVFTLARDALALVTAGGDLQVSAGNWALSLGGGPPNNADFPGGGAVLKTTLTVT